MLASLGPVVIPRLSPCCSPVDQRRRIAAVSGGVSRDADRSPLCADAGYWTAGRALRAAVYLR
jgi:hypothetical protein